MALIFPSVNGQCEHIHEINTNTIIKNTCTHSHVSDALLESETVPHFRGENGVAYVPRVWLPLAVDAVNKENAEGLLGLDKLADKGPCTLQHIYNWE